MRSSCLCGLLGLLALGCLEVHGYSAVVFNLGLLCVSIVGYFGVECRKLIKKPLVLNPQNSKIPRRPQYRSKGFWIRCPTLVAFCFGLLGYPGAAVSMKDQHG